MTDTTPKVRKPVIPWFGAMFASIIGMAIFLDQSGIDDPLIANGLMLIPILFLVKAGMNAMHNAGSRGAVGSPARNYLKRMVIVSVGYVGSLFAATALIDDGDPITVLSVMIAIVPGLAVAGYFYAIGRFMIEQQDEFLRMLMVRQSLIATGLSLSAASVWGFLESFGQVPHVDAYWWPIVWFFGLGIGALINKLAYGTTGDCA
ncbi:hypothetical protein [Sphingomicrobium sediminis]|uniref:Uncharacterized protein n=1 Tax=Sphingomicrobium sediminis TaxID=2950949 RepID=A0A9X2EI33_9SPHN|nr:hypothetical protein [Sphingomicrobium sediminis]MCM8557901.1 hypothetical protein [Sphingomicrobium sediminis]